MTALNMRFGESDRPITYYRREVIPAEEVRAGDLLGDYSRGTYNGRPKVFSVVESAEVVPVGPDWIVQAYLEGADDYGVGLPTITWGLDYEVEVWR